MFLTNTSAILHSMFDFFYDTSKNQARKRQSARTKNDRSKWTAENWDSSTPTQNRNRVTRDGDELLHHLEEAVMTDEEVDTMTAEETTEADTTREVTTGATEETIDVIKLEAAEDTMIDDVTTVHSTTIAEAVMTDEEGAVMMIEEVVMTEDKLNTAEVTTDGNSIFFELTNTWTTSSCQRLSISMVVSWFSPGWKTQTWWLDSFDRFDGCDLLFEAIILMHAFVIIW